MTKSTLAIGAAGCLVLAVSGIAWAQDAQQGPAQIPSAPAAEPCSGLGCVFPSSTPTQPVAQAPARAEAMSSAPTAAVDTVDTPETKRKSRAKPIPTVTIAASTAEAGRIRELAAAFPKGKIKVIVESAERGARSDFAVDASVDADAAGEKAKLFTEQLHVVAGNGVASIADLDGKVVSFGLDRSAGQAAARRAFEALHVKVKETPLDLDNALDGLATGDVAAVVVLAPQPIKRLETVSGQGLHLVGLPEGATLPQGTVATKIDAARYPSLAKAGSTIRTVGVETVLRISPKGVHLAASKTFLALLAQRSADLSRRGFDLIKADLSERRGRHFASDAR